MAKIPDPALTPKQAAFVREYLVDHNAKQAAIRAGYSEKTAEQSGSRLLGDLKVGSEIRRLETKAFENVAVTKSWVIAKVATALQQAADERHYAGTARLGELIARLHGYIIDRKEVRRIARWQDLTDEELATLAQMDEPEGKGTRH
jgi:phage terminase small subunit